MKKEQNLEISDELENDIEDAKALIPSMNVNLPEKVEEEKLIEGKKVVEVYDEILNDLRCNTVEVDDLISNFENMVMNEGDATSASKEALVNLVKLKSDIADKKAKIAELMTRCVLKEKDTFPRYLAAHQNNTINVDKRIDRRSLIAQAKKEIDINDE